MPTFVPTFQGETEQISVPDNSEGLAAMKKKKKVYRHEIDDQYESIK